MITFDQAEQDGYTFDSDTVPGACVIGNADGVIAQIHSDCPRFFALRFVAELVGDDLATTDVTPTLVQQTTGETYVDPNEPVPAPVPTVQEKVAAALEQIQTGDGTQPVTADQLVTVIQALAS